MTHILIGGRDKLGDYEFTCESCRQSFLFALGSPSKHEWLDLRQAHCPGKPEPDLIAEREAMLASDQIAPKTWRFK